ncbi:type IV secretory system conjugative DNA transfer family protein [Candidatus Bipolaricaulota bacterium]|nr:type IV secretory system conjugative DNA transfer family protein [Candidatus Bipolaricaulota bacterium]
MLNKLEKTAEVLFGGDKVPMGKKGFRTHKIPKEATRIHSFTVGSSGTGKSRHMLFRIERALERGEGIGLIDPKGDIYRLLLKSIYDKIRNGENLAKRLVLFDPTASRLPAFNPLEVNSTDQEDQYQKALATMKVFKKMFGDAWGDRLADILLNSLLLLVERGEPFTRIPRLLTDEEYRKYMVKDLNNRQVKEFWEHRHGKLPENVRRQWIESTLNKVNKYYTSPQARNILGQRKSSIDFRDIIDNNKIFLANLPKGQLGETAFLLGAFLVSSINQAAISRATLPKSQKPLFHLFIDEAQDVITEDTRTVLAQSRSSGLSIHMASQDLQGEFDHDLRSGILSNCKTLISFRCSRESADIMAPMMFQASGEEIKFQSGESLLGEPTDKPLYRSITEEHERSANDLVNLEPRKFYLKVRGQRGEPKLLRTIDTPEYGVGRQAARNFAEKAMKPYTEKRDVIEKKLEKRVNEIEKKVNKAVMNGKI